MTVGFCSRKDLKTPPSKTVNVFDLTSRSKETTQDDLYRYSAKEKAARITLYAIITMLVLTAVFLLLGEAFGLQWSICSRPHNKTIHDTRYTWPWNWKHDGPSLSVSESFKDHWNTLSLTEKRKELLRATLGELDLYEIYDISRDKNEPLDSEENT